MYKIPSWLFYAAWILVGSSYLHGQEAEQIYFMSGQSFSRQISAPDLPGSLEFSTLNNLPPCPPSSISDTIPIKNFACVSDGIFRGAKLEQEEQYRYLKESLGVDTIINLAMGHEDTILCERYRLRCVDFNIRLFPGSDMIFFNWEALRQAFLFVIHEHEAGRKVYFHCRHGSDRTGTLAAAITIRENACGANFEKNKLWSKVDKTLHQHHFHKVYFHLHGKIRRMVYHFDKNSWLCQ